MLSNAHFLAKFRFDTAENEPAKNLQKLLTLLTLGAPRERHPPRDRAAQAVQGEPAARAHGGVAAQGARR